MWFFGGLSFGERLGLRESLPVPILWACAMLGTRSVMSEDLYRCFALVSLFRSLTKFFHVVSLRLARAPHLFRTALAGRGEGYDFRFSVKRSRCRCHMICRRYALFSFVIIAAGRCEPQSERASYVRRSMQYSPPFFVLSCACFVSPTPRSCPSFGSEDMTSAQSPLSCFPNSWHSASRNPTFNQPEGVHLADLLVAHARRVRG